MGINESDDIHWMQHALALAERASEAGEVPVGAVIIFENTIVGEGWNRPISTCDPTAHAEVIAMREAAINLSNYRLCNTALYVTLEPCMMCAGAMVHARIQRLVYGANDPKRGARELFQQPGLNHSVEIVNGVLADECSHQLKTFFRDRRN